MPLPVAIGALSLALIVPLVVKVLLAFGIGITTYVGADYAVTFAQSYITSQYNSFPSDLFNILAMSGFMQGLNMVFAAFTTSIAIRITMGAFTKIGFGGNS